MDITEQQLLLILPNAGRIAGVFAPALNAAMGEYQIITRLRSAAFIAQIGHESSQLTRLVENLNYSANGLADTWPNRYAEMNGKGGGYVKTVVNNTVRNKPNALAMSLAGKAELIASHVYAGRMGNTAPGDGWKYRGRGLIQVTGKHNYRLCGDALGLDLVSHPEWLGQPRHAVMSAAWFWSVNRLNILADVSDIQNIGSIINTGGKGRTPNGAAARQVLYQQALKVLT
ncbi:glycoside hydrolase family 19 protein [Pseudomonas fluorescens]|uniref:glycoside hydrolase family 19 protein n=1 Tax=Pseudomonas fluorescens TaxID=294 RepID=UPI001BECB843|nr:glycoside hydrolase family 19 protein [Pseudomonas fluorescens]MBT2371982.1 glycoside hydrolase family 19 protein [Pseudomonas fluorescens]